MSRRTPRVAPLWLVAALLAAAFAAVAHTSHCQTAAPIFGVDDLIGTQTDGVRVRVTNTGGAPQVGNINVGEQVLLDGPLPGNARGLFPVLNFSGGGSFGGEVPYPAGTAGDDFAFEATGLLHIPAAGSYVIGVNSDDGFRLRMGTDFATVSEFFGPTGNSDTRVVVNFDQPGLIPYRLTHFERSGGEFIEFYAKPGTNTALDLTQDRLIGDTANGGLQTIAAGQFYLRDVKSPGTVNNLADADALLRGDVVPSLETNAFSSFIDFLDGGGTGNYPNNLPFPGGSGRDDFGLEATAMVLIPMAGTYTFGNNSDDGARVQIQGQRVINADVLQGRTDAFGTITFDAPGFYDLRYLHFERAGGAGAELFAAQGVHGSFDAGQFRLVGDVANGGLAVFSPKGWRADVGGDYHDAANWRDGQVAGGAGAFASFSLVDLSADRTVNLNAPVTLGHLRLGDVDATGGPHGWQFSGVGELNLVSAGAFKPVIEVLNGTTTMNVPITGSDGFAKQGGGTLVLGQTPTYSGDTAIRGGTVELGSGVSLPSTTALSLGQGGDAGTLVLNGNNQTVTGLATSGTAGADNRIVNSSPTALTLTVDSPAGQFGRFTGTLGGPGANDNNFALFKQGEGVLQITNPASYSGATTITGGTVELGLGPGVGGAKLWLDANNFAAVQTSGGLVQGWLDQSGNARHATASGLTQPTATTNPLVNNLGVISFDGTNQMLSVDLSFLAGSEYTMFAVEGRTGDGNHYFLGTTPGATNQGLHVGYRNNTTYTLAQFANDLNTGVPGFTSQQFRVWANELDFASGHAIYLNGGLANSNTNIVPLTTANNGRIGTGHGGQWYQGDLGELLLFDRALTTEERQRVEQYLDMKWFQGVSSGDNILPTDTDLRIGVDGTLELQGTSQAVASFADHAGAGGTLANRGGGPATFTTGSGGGDHTFSGTIIDTDATPLSFVKAGNGSQTLAGPGIQYRGDTTVDGGALRFDDAVNFGSNQLSPASMNLDNGASLEFHVSAGNQQNLGLGAPLAITGDGNFTRTGDGLLALGGSHSYSGTTTLEGGTLRLEASPGVGGAQLWLDGSANHTLTLAGNSVQQWDDRSGNDRHATLVSNSPTSLTNVLANDRGVIRFGSNQALDVDLKFLEGSEYTIFAVEGRTGTGNHYFLGTNTATSTNNALHIGYRNNNEYTLAQYGNDLNVPGLAGFTSQEFTTWSNLLEFGEGHAVYRDGVLVGSNANTTPLSGGDNGRVGTGFGTQWFNGDIAEILIFDRALTTAERESVEAYLDAKWQSGGLANVLPADTDLRIGAATLDLNGISQTVASLADHGPGGGTIINPGGGPVTLTTGSGGGDHTFSGTMTDTPNSPMSFTKQGTGSQTLAGPGIQYRGNTTVDGGSLRFDDAVNFGNNQVTPVTMNLDNGASLEFHVSAGNTQQVGVSSGATITGDGNFTRTGDGLLALGGNHSYSGSTTLEGGTLRLEASPGVGGAQLWLDGSAGHTLTLAGNSVQQWDDRSGNDRHATPVTNSPTSLVNPLANERGVIRFGSNQALDVDLKFLEGSEYTIFAVEGRTGTGNHYFLGTNTANSPNNSLHIGYRNNNQYTLAQFSNDLEVPGLAGFTSQEFTTWSNLLEFGQGHAIYRDGVLMASNTNTTPLAGGDNGRVGTGFGAQWFNGDIAEILIFDRALTTAEREAVESYLDAKWVSGGLANVLPTDTDLRIGAATLDLNGISQTVASLADLGAGGGAIINPGGSGPATLTTGSGGGHHTFSGAMTDTPNSPMSFTKQGTGSQTLAGPGIQYRGNTTVDGGRLVFDDAVNFGNNQVNPVTLDLANNAELEFHVSVGNTQSLGTAGQASITGDGSVIKSGGGTLVTGSAHSYTGATIVTGGTLRLETGHGVAGADLWLDATAAGTVQTTGNLVDQWLDLSGNNRHATASGTARPELGVSAVNGASVLQFDGVNDIMSVDLAFLNNSEYTIFAVEARAAADSANRYFLGTGTGASNQGLHVGYRNNNTYTLAQFANDLNVPVPGFTSQELHFWSNVLDFSEGHAVFRDGVLLGANNNTVPLTNPGPGRIGSGFSNQFFFGDIGEILIFDRALSNAERSAVEAYLNMKWLQGGLPTENLLPVTTDLRIAGGATVDLNGFSQQVASLNDEGGAGGLLTNEGTAPVTLTIDGPDDAGFSGVIADGSGGGVVSLVKDGAGTQTLSGDNTYTGPTDVQGGTLLVNGDQSAATGDVTVHSAATLGGTGIIGGATVIAAGGTLSPGNSAGTLGFISDLTLQPDATLFSDVLFGGSATDLVVVGGNVSLDGAILDGTWGGGSGNVFGGTYSADNMFWLIDNQGQGPIDGRFANTTPAPAFAGLFDGVVPDLVTIDGQLFAAFYESQFGVFSQTGLTGGNDFLLVSIPEPSRALLLVLALGSLLLRRQRP